MIPVGVWASAFPDLTLPKLTGLILGLAAFRLTVLCVHDRRSLVWGLALFGLLGLGIALAGALGARWPSKVSALQAIGYRMPRLLSQLPGMASDGVNANQLAGVLALYLPLAAACTGRVAGRKTHPGRPGQPGWLWAGSRHAGVDANARRLDRRGRGVGRARRSLAAGKMSRRARVGALLLVLLLGTAILGIGAYFGRAKLAGLLDSTGNATGLDLATNQLSLAGRVEIWSRAIYAIEDFPFTGCGLGAFRRVAPLLYPLFLVGPETDMAHAHNIFLQIALDLGLPRLVAYLAVLATAAVAAWQTARRSQGVTQAVALGLLAGLVALHVYGLADAIALGSKPGLVFWVALGLLAARLETDKVNEVSVGVVPSSALGPLHAREQLGKPPAGATDPVDS